MPPRAKKTGPTEVPAASAPKVQRHMTKIFNCTFTQALIGSLDGGCHEDSTNSKAQAEIYCPK
jgi:hypothetical protein